MTTAQVLFEQYKVLPKRIQQQFKQLITQADQPAARPSAAPAADEEDEDGDTDTTIRISRAALEVSIEQVKLLRAGKAELSTLEELFADLEAESHA